MLAATIWTYWLGVGLMVFRVHRKSRRLGGLVPEQPVERLMWIVWVPLVTAWLTLPYLALAFFPRWRERLPRPGAWMARLKQLLAFPLYATVLWLLWVLGAQLDNDAVAHVHFTDLLSVAVGAKATLTRLESDLLRRPRAELTIGCRAAAILDCRCLAQRSCRSRALSVRVTEATWTLDR